MSEVNKNNFIVSDFIKSRKDLIKHNLTEIEELKKDTVNTAVEHSIEHNLNFPIELKNICFESTKKALISFLYKKLIKEEEISTDMINLLIDITEKDENGYIIEKIEKSFNFWSLKSKLAFSLFVDKKNSADHFNFVKLFLKNDFNIYTYDSLLDNFFLISRSHKENKAYLNIDIENIEKKSDYLTIVDTILKLAELDYKPDFYICDLNYIYIDFDNKKVKRFESEFYQNYSFKEKIIAAIKTENKNLRDLLGEDFDWNHD